MKSVFYTNKNVFVVRNKRIGKIHEPYRKQTPKSYAMQIARMMEFEDNIFKTIIRVKFKDAKTTENNSQGFLPIDGIESTDNFQRKMKKNKERWKRNKKRRTQS